MGTPDTSPGDQMTVLDQCRDMGKARGLDGDDLEQFAQALAGGAVTFEGIIEDSKPGGSRKIREIRNIRPFRVR